MHTAHVKSIPRWWRFVPFFRENLATALYPYIYLPRDMYENIVSIKPTRENLAVIVHEEAHLKQQKDIGPILYGFKYLLSKRFRLDEELLAIREEMLYRKVHNLTYNIERKARQFASGTYLWVMPYEEAHRTLSRLWQMI